MRSSNKNQMLISYSTEQSTPVNRKVSHITPCYFAGRWLVSVHKTQRKTLRGKMRIIGPMESWPRVYGVAKLVWYAAQHLRAPEVVALSTYRPLPHRQGSVRSRMGCRLPSRRTHPSLSCPSPRNPEPRPFSRDSQGCQSRMKGNRDLRTRLRQ